MDEYYGAAVCRKGHIRDAKIELSGRMRASISEGVGAPLGKYCPECGELVITKCETCGHRVLGRRVRQTARPYKPPQFCDSCGSPHSWLDRQGRIDLLEKRLTEETNLDESARVKIREQLDALRDPNLTEKQELEILKRVRKLAGAAWDEGSIRQIVVGLVTGAVRDGLGWS